MTPVATTARGTEATRLHWRGQQQIQRATAQTVRELWPLLLKELAGTASEDRDWLTQTAIALMMLRAQSAALGATYWRAYALAETGRQVLFTPPPPTADTVSALRDSLIDRGPIMRNRLRAAGQPAAADDASLKATIGSAQRHVIAGGRDAVVAATDTDPAVKGWRRLPNGDTCPFCLMLVDRGAVYSKDTARFAAHDWCDCMAEPAFDSGRPVSEVAQRASKRQQDADDRAYVRAWLAEHGARATAEHAVT